MLPTSGQISRRRATVLVMVVGVLAMLFVVGSTLLVVSRFERQSVTIKTQAASRSDGTSAVIDSIAQQLRTSLVGSDGQAYNRGWYAPGVEGTGDAELGESYATYGGLVQNLSHPLQNILRGGNLLLASNHPAASNGVYTWPQVSWDKLFVPLGYTGAPRVNFRVNFNVLGNPQYDADGDGVLDSDSIRFDAFFRNIRVVSHGGMVQLDPLTHPSLLAQVIHPQDLVSAGVNMSVAAGGFSLQTAVSYLSLNPAEVEPLLRRRGMLATDLKPAELTSLATLAAPNQDVRAQLPFTLGYQANAPWSSTDWTPHWPQVTANRGTGTTTDDRWWKARMTPPPALTDATYDRTTDNFDRKSMITTESSDDLLRPRRDENRLKDFGLATVGGVPQPLTSVHEVLNPSADALTRPVTAAGGYHVTTGYGWMPQPTPDPVKQPVQWQLLFNSGTRTQMSLRDILVDWDTTDVSGLPWPVTVPAGVNLPYYPVSAAFAVNYQSAGALFGANGHYLESGTTYRRLQQLASMYLAMIQHTTVPGTFETSPSSLPTAAAGRDITNQVLIAAQLAVNTVDFADPDDIPTRFRWSVSVNGSIESADVIGVERQPYITEAYARIVQKTRKVLVGDDYEWNPDIDTASSVIAIELYNPYDVPLDLRNYQVVMGGVPVPFVDSSLATVRPFINPQSYVILTNRAPTTAWLAAAQVKVPIVYSDPPTAGQNVFVSSLLDAAMLSMRGEPIQLQRCTWTGTEKHPSYLDVGNPAPLNGVVASKPEFKDEAFTVDILSPAPKGVDPANSTTWLGGKPTSWGRPRYIKDVNFFYDETGSPRGVPQTDDDSPVDLPKYYDLRRPGQKQLGGPITGDPATDVLIRDYSLQRHKEAINPALATAGEPYAPPVHWHFTMARQHLFPMASEYTYRLTPTGMYDNLVADDATCPLRHNLFGYQTPSFYVNPQEYPLRTLDPQSDVVDREFRGLPTVGVTRSSDPSKTKSWEILAPANPVFVQKDPIAGVPVVLGRALPETPHPHSATYTNAWVYKLAEPVSCVEVIYDTDPPFGSSKRPVVGSPTTAAGDGSSIVGDVNGPPVVDTLIFSYPAGSASEGFRVKAIREVRRFGGTTLELPVAPLAFPTTGSLLLVSRYAHRHLDNTLTLPASQHVAAEIPAGSGRALIVPPLVTPGVGGQLQQLDHGHMPIWDTLQTTTDNADLSGNPNIAMEWQVPQSGTSMPWGQLVFNYFTALPIEQMYHHRDLSRVSPTLGMGRLVDFANDRQQFNVLYNLFFPGLPAVEPVMTPSGPVVGPKVRGRININTAPAWVLDGLPMLAWGEMPASELSPVRQLSASDFYSKADGVVSSAGSKIAYDRLPGLMFTTDTADEDGPVGTAGTTQWTLNRGFDWSARVGGRADTPFNLPSVGSRLASTIADYRQVGKVSSINGYVNLLPTSSVPGYQSVGQLGDVLGRYVVRVNGVTGAGGPVDLPMSVAAVPAAGLGIREYMTTVGGTTYRPYASINYLQMVTPLVRLQDWATVKDHVFTVYLTQGDTSADPAVWTHTEVTLDRTRCLTTNDPPARISETPAINYYNVVNDQK